MKYSPLVERYLLTHKYETMNNVRGWKTLLTQKNEAQKDADRRIKTYRQIADQIVARCKQRDQQYKDEVARVKQELAKMDKKGHDHQDTLKESADQMMKNGTYAEKSNMIVSMSQADNQRMLEGQNQL